MAPMDTTPSDLSDLSARLCEEQAAVELEVACVLLNDPASGAMVDKALGLSAALFVNFLDARMIFLACDMVGGRGRPAVLSLIRFALKAEGYWCDGARAHEVWSGAWSDAGLDAFANHFAPFPAPAMQASTLRLLVPRLIDLYRRQRDAAEHYRQACRILDGRAA